MLELTRKVMQAPLTRKWLAEAGWLVLSLTMVVPLWVIAYPPLQDFPQHVATARVLASYSDPSFGFSRYFEPNLATQYLVPPLAGALLTWLVGPLTACKLLLSAGIAASSYAMRSLLSSLAAPRIYALFVLPLTYNSQLGLGFLSFVMAVPLMLWGLALSVRLSSEFHRGHAVLLGVVSVVCLYTHLVPYGVLILGAGVVFVSRDLVQIARRALPLLPSLLLALFGTAGSSLLSAGLFGEEQAHCPVYDETSLLLASIPHWLTDILHSSLDEQLLVVWVLWWLLVLIVGLHFGNTRASPRRLKLALGFPLLLALYFVMPRTACNLAWPVHARFLVLAAFVAPLVLPDVPRWCRSATAGILGGLIVVGANNLTKEFRAFEKNEVGDFREAISSIPMGQRVASLIFHHRSSTVRWAAFLHYGALCQASRGGAVLYSFADLPWWPVRLRSELGAPSPSWNFMYNPVAVNPFLELRWYDYVLARGGPGQLPQTPLLQPVYSGSFWSVFKVVRPGEPVPGAVPAGNISGTYGSYGVGSN
ncbi:MAG: hypothetical protein MJD61_15580 [Proteobacteria bacterium]|nr:hypothetical protein [Pseudomonadota bacterium]